MGVPGDADFQRDVLLASLKLFGTEKGPVLMDYPAEIPVDGPDSESQGDQVLACPVNFDPQKAKDALTDSDKAASLFKKEIMQLRAWYGLFLRKNSRTTMGISGMNIDALVKFLGAFYKGELPKNPRDDLNLAEIVKLATEDLKVFYFEAFSAQPGPIPNPETLSDWFWNQTLASGLMFQIQKVCLKSPDKALQILGKALLIPVGRAK